MEPQAIHTINLGDATLLRDCDSKDLKKGNKIMVGVFDSSGKKLGVISAVIERVI